jgi:threonine/homoserine/homoserine lactone efflux protein
MNDLLLFLKGMFIGLAISAPIGPVGVLVLRRAMLHGFGTGVMSGLGAAIADGVLSGALALGLAAVSGFFDHWAGEFKAVGGFFLVVIGWWVWHTSPPHELKPLPQRRGTVGDLVSIFLLTLSNPMTILRHRQPSRPNATGCHQCRRVAPTCEPPRPVQRCHRAVRRARRPVRLRTSTREL